MLDFPREDAHYRHAHRNAEGDLRQDHRLHAVRHRRVDFDAAIHRPRMHHDGVRFGQLEFFRRQAPVLVVLAGGGQARAAHALVLQTQHQHRVDVLDAFFHLVEHVHAEVFHIARQQGLGRHHAHFRTAQRGQRMNLGAGDARMQHIADDGNPQVVERTLVVTQREHVEQALGRVRAAAIAGVDDMDVGRDMAGDQMPGAGGGVAHDEHVGLHRRQVGDGVEQGFALALRRGVDVQVDHVGGQPFGGDLEGGAGARGVLEEDVEDGLAAQQRHFLHIAFRFRHGHERRMQCRESGSGCAPAAHPGSADGASGHRRSIADWRLALMTSSS
jgi:hypothetical protein